MKLNYYRYMTKNGYVYVDAESTLRAMRMTEGFPIPYAAIPTDTGKMEVYDHKHHYYKRANTWE